MLQDILIAAVAALILTWVIRTASKVMKVVVTRSTELGYRPNDLEEVLKRCYSLFPEESLLFKGATFTRGMAVRVITNRNRTIEGKFVGTNGDNVVCFLTARSIVAHELGNIQEIRMITND